MKILVVGSGGREHALAWKLAQSPRVSKVYVAPGNAGTQEEAGCENVDINAEDIYSLLNFAEAKRVAFTLVGPEAPIVAGIAERFHCRSLRCLAPNSGPAQLEGSKAFAKSFMHRHGIPTAEYRVFEIADEAIEYIYQRGTPIVVKADGLAAGKGVVVAHSIREATSAVEGMLSGSRFGDAGRKVVIEEFLEGEEASFIAICDGATALPFASSQDHKPAFDGDQGPNTGGMGAYSPAPVVTTDVHDKVMSNIIEPTLKGMAAEGTPYVGFLYAGLMIVDSVHPKVVEFNCRFGDPEAQPVMVRLKSDLFELCEAALDGSLSSQDAEFHNESAVGVVLASKGYPGSYEKGVPIQCDLDPDLPAKVFHAGTSRRDGRLVTSGGRVLCAVGKGADFIEAQTIAYQAVHQIAWPDAMYRTDIGYRAIGR